MTRMVITTAAMLGFLLGTAAIATAKPHDIRIEMKLETVKAIHVPTGCVSSVEYDDGAYVQAFITDPLCLPEGVGKRTIPASERDFYPLSAQEAALL